MVWATWASTLLGQGCVFDPTAKVPDKIDGSVLCGNGQVDPGENCDGTNLNGETCEDLGYLGGQLACDDTCHFDHSQCTGGAVCGNGTIDPGEDCDGGKLGGNTCETLHFTGGTLKCGQDCLFDTSDCQIPDNCGNGTLDAGEACDDGNNDDADGCSASCQQESGWNCQGEPSTCTPVCGDDRALGQEPCDGSDLKNQTCQTRGFAGGTLGCNATCSAFDTSACFLCGDDICSDSLGEDVGICPEDCGFLAISSGGHHTCALRGNGTAWCWGYNGDGRLGDGTNTDHRTPVRVTGITDVQEVTAGRQHSCAVDATGTPWCWGNNNYGQLRDGTTTGRNRPVQVSNLQGILDVDAGRYYTCAVSDLGTGLC